MKSRKKHNSVSHAIAYTAVLTICIAIPLLLEYCTTQEPKSRNIHIEAFRYGTSPSIIRVNRGDELNLTFSTRDTGHSFFLQDYRIEAKISPASETIAIWDPLLATEPPVNVKELRLTAGLKGWWGKLVSLSRFRCHTYCGRMHGFEQGDLIVRPNWFFAASLGLLAAIVIIGYIRVRWNDPVIKAVPPPIDLNGQFPLLDKILKWRPLQFICTLPVLAVFIIVVLAGFFGTKVGGRNLGVMLTWNVWMALLTLVLVPLGGRIWCLLCPLPALGEYLQRAATTQVRPAKKKGLFNNRFFGFGLRWPKALRGPWIRMLIYLSLGTLSASMSGQPRWTATVLFSLAIIAILMSLIWELRSFCRYVCPVGTFISLYSPLGRVMVRSRDIEVCRNCKEKTCLRGNEKGWACPYGLCVADINRNVDCGLCMECFKSCPYDNVSLAIRKGSWSEYFSQYGEAWQAIVLLVLGMVYPLTILSPWPFMRDIVNVVDKVTWGQFVCYAVVLWSVALGVVPLVFWLATGLGMYFVRTEKTDNSERTGVFSSATGNVLKKIMPALIPLGLSFWASFFVATVMINFTFVLQTLSDPFGDGWNLLGMAGKPWVQIWPSGVPWLQAALVLLGLTYSLKKGYALWFSEVDDKKAALRGFAPTAAVLIGLAGWMLVYFTNF